jgi:hypothetical protein
MQLLEDHLCHSHLENWNSFGEDSQELELEARQ